MKVKSYALNNLDSQTSIGYARTNNKIWFIILVSVDIDEDMYEIFNRR